MRSFGTTTEQPQEKPAATWGGSRAGSGRKATGKKVLYKNITISGTPEQLEELKQKAQEAELTVSKFVLKKCLEPSPLNEQSG